jgi:hypothetical protein
MILRIAGKKKRAGGPLLSIGVLQEKTIDVLRLPVDIFIREPGTTSL